MKKIFRKSYLLLSIITCLYLLFFPWASFGVEQTEKSPRISVLSRPFEENEKEQYKLQTRQPYRFDSKTMMKIMSSLAYQKRNLTWSNQRRVFTTSTLKVLVPRIVQQFAEVNPDERVFFQLKNPSGKILLEGDTFMAADGLNWRLTVIQKMRRKVDDFSVSGESWRLVPRAHQTYKTKQRYQNLIEDITNWVVLNKVQAKPERILPPSPAQGENESPKMPGRSDFKERLRILEDLKKEGMIDDEEYKNKRQEILKDL